MIVNDPTQLAALAALVGITVKTHPHLTMQYWEPDFPEGGMVGEVMKLPALDTPAGDDVFLAPVMRWLHLSFDAVSFVWVQGELICLLTSKDKDKFVGDPCIGFTRVVPLIRACQSARVPEICAIFGSDDHA